MVLEQASQKALVSLARPNCAQLFFIYPGRNVGLRGRGITFLSMIRNGGLGDRNLALVADPFNDNYAQGVSPDIPDLPSLLAWHKNVLRAMPHVTEFYTIGDSSGGYGALLFGHLLGARKVWAFVPRTARLETADAAKAFLKEQLSAGSGTTEYVFTYSPSNGRDCAFADYFSKCPGVVLSPYAVPPPDQTPGTKEAAMNVESYYHRRVLQTVIDNGDLRGLMPPFKAVAVKRGEQD